MSTHNVNLSPQQAQFVHKMIAQGEYCNASEVVRAGLRALEMQREAEALKLEALRTMLARGLAEDDAGTYAEYSLEKIRKKLSKKRKKANA